MCGIAGIFRYTRDGAPVDREELLRMREAMQTRGPDGAGLWLSADGSIGLAHRRLSIIDLSDAGAQPMTDTGGRLHIVFNGEIYNYRALRRDLENGGYHFRSTSDTEVLLALYRERGADMLSSLRGMYAFAIYDETDRSLFLARDPFGIKPLYYADDGRCFRWASQVRALQKGCVDTEPDPAGHVGFFLWGSVPEPHTLFRGIRALPAGTSFRVDPTGCGKPRIFCSIPALLAEADAKPARFGRDEALERIRASLADSVAHHLIADVAVGMFLSAGLDSAMVAGLATRQSHGRLRTVTLGFSEYRNSEDDETVLAAGMALRLGTDHQTRWIQGAEFQAERERLLSVMDQPSIDGVNSYFVSKATAAAGLKVALSGLGGDELFGSYPSFHQIPRMARLLAPLRYMPAVGRGFRWVAAPWLKHCTSPKYAGVLEYGPTWGGAYLLRRGLFMPWELPRILDPEMVREGWRTLQPILRLEETIKGIRSAHLRVSALETTWYMRNQLLRDADWAGMAHSLEIRVPLVDIELLKALAPLMAHTAPITKRDVALAVSASLPLETVNRPKTGFSVPVQSWTMAGGRPDRLSRGLRGWAHDVHTALSRH
jgi:asparagine synthase (glutamine-hydrolysing)